jgi:cell division protein FtsN
MLQSTSTRSIGIVLAATVAAGAAGLIASISIVPEARAESTTASAQAVTASAQPAKDDRLGTRVTDACQGWPNLDQSCIKRSDDKARKVRVIAINNIGTDPRADTRRGR